MSDFKVIEISEEIIKTLSLGLEFSKQQYVVREDYKVFASPLEALKEHFKENVNELVKLLINESLCDISIVDNEFQINIREDDSDFDSAHKKLCAIAEYEAFCYSKESIHNSLDDNIEDINATTIKMAQAYLEYEKLNLKD